MALIDLAIVNAITASIMMGNVHLVGQLISPKQNTVGRTLTTLPYTQLTDPCRSVGSVLRLASRRIWPRKTGTGRRSGPGTGPVGVVQGLGQSRDRASRSGPGTGAVQGPGW